MNFYVLRHIFTLYLHNQTQMVGDTLFLYQLFLIPPNLFLFNISCFVSKPFLAKTTTCTIGYTSQLKKYIKIQFILYLSYFKIKIGNHFHSFSPFILHPSTMFNFEKSWQNLSRRRKETSIVNLPHQIDIGGFYFEFLNFFFILKNSQNL